MVNHGPLRLGTFGLPPPRALHVLAAYHPDAALSWTLQMVFLAESLQRSVRRDFVTAVQQERQVWHGPWGGIITFFSAP